MVLQDVESNRHHNCSPKVLLEKDPIVEQNAQLAEGTDCANQEALVEPIIIISVLPFVNQDGIVASPKNPEYIDAKKLELDMARSLIFPPAEVNDVCGPQCY